MTAQISLACGAVALVDAADFDMLRKHSWHRSGRQERFYASAHIKMPDGRFKGVLMHRFIIDAKPGELVDHINGNTLDNRRCNLRIATAQQNAANSRSRGASKYPGVRQTAGGWYASITPNELAIYLGRHATEAQASAVYGAAAARIFGEFATTCSAAPDWGALQQVIDSKRKQISRLQEELAYLTGEKEWIATSTQP